MPKDVKLVLFAGAGGGLLSWIYTIMVGTTFGIDRWLALPCCIALGMGSALIAVYVITPTDVSKTGQLIGYAVLCGITWKPILDAGRVVISQRIEVSQQRQQTQAAAQQLKTAPPAEVTKQVAAAVDSTTKLLRGADRLGSDELKKDAAQPAKEAVNAIAATSTHDPEAAKVALHEIALAARESDNLDVAKVAEAKIQSLQIAPDSRRQPADFSKRFKTDFSHPSLDRQKQPAVSPP
jgi:hypothetical protein